MKRSAACTAALALVLMGCSFVGFATARSGPRHHKKPHVIHHTATTNVEFSATKDAEGNVTAAATLSSTKPTCHNAGRMADLFNFAWLGYGSELIPERLGNGGQEPNEGTVTAAKLTPISAAEVSPWVWQHSWPGTEQVYVGTGGRRFKSTVAKANWAFLEIDLYSHSKGYRHGKTLEIVYCPHKIFREWIPLP